MNNNKFNNLGIIQFTNILNQLSVLEYIYSWWSFYYFNIIIYFLNTVRLLFDENIDHIAKQ